VRVALDNLAWFSALLLDLGRLVPVIGFTLNISRRGSSRSASASVERAATPDPLRSSMDRSIPNRVSSFLALGIIALTLPLEDAPLDGDDEYIFTPKNRWSGPIAQRVCDRYIKSKIYLRSQNPGSMVGIPAGSRVSALVGVEFYKQSKGESLRAFEVENEMTRMTNGIDVFKFFKCFLSSFHSISLFIKHNSMYYQSLKPLGRSFTNPCYLTCTTEFTC